jgi:6-pyruvoyltetrahydropterin/6-carboxytetrahydropterin synthase
MTQSTMGPVTELVRIVRLAVNGHGVADLPGPPNGHGGSPSMVGIGHHFEVHVRCRGDLGKRTGYIVNIKVIDEAVRTHALPILQDACRAGNDAQPAAVVRQIHDAISGACPATIAAVSLHLSPYYCIEVETNRPSQVLVRQRFEFAASHRLHVEHLSDEENRALFGKCNNPCGHGHNYVVEPCIACDVDSKGGCSLTLVDLERLTSEHVIEPFDHRNLNEEIEEFGPGGVNPTVENIAMACFKRLADPIKNLGDHACLRSVTVWESDRTAATYPAS